MCRKAGAERPGAPRLLEHEPGTDDRQRALEAVVDAGVPVLELLVEDVDAAGLEVLGDHAGTPPQVELVAGAAVHEDALELAERVRKDVRTLCTALGYDINTVEFAIKDGVPYAIDFMNPAPDAELASVGEFYHNWITNAVVDLVFRRLSEPAQRPRYRWDAFLNPEPVQAYAVASAAEQQARTITPNPAVVATSKKTPARKKKS